ncbi:hypothetical protein C2E20_4870 [Micractinium conductrix]|uniref:Uncharacterized protein n=1 Tax=Micractinium conductrix TaxID=554055 RepID=A0A2P6VCN6_9CHLO|nr:hypothetical protein C2E20_4870 [Micractinium conductrix]|eukprot:PSC71821.1 hypothetical protein C2E20_4870 [Micractinium conductrix]
MASRASPLGGIMHNAFGFRGRRNVMAWLLAGGIAYYLYVKPVQARDDEQRRVRDQAKQWAEDAAVAAGRSDRQ